MDAHDLPPDGLLHLSRDVSRGGGRLDTLIVQKAEQLLAHASRQVPVWLGVASPKRALEASCLARFKRTADKRQAAAVVITIEFRFVTAAEAERIAADMTRNAGTA